jgi:hypothetical protein
VSRFLPSFIKVEEWRWTPNFVWPILLAVFVVFYALVRTPRGRWPFGRHAGLAGLLLVLVFAQFVAVPRLVLGTPRPAELPGGDTLSFFGLSRVAHMHAPARFSLLEDGRDYDFYFTSPRRMERLRVDFGNAKGDYDLTLGFFDEQTVSLPTHGGLDMRVFENPPAYSLGKSYLYRIAIRLEKKSDVRTGIDPYQFALEPVR